MYGHTYPGGSISKSKIVINEDYIANRGGSFAAGWDGTPRISGLRRLPVPTSGVCPLNIPARQPITVNFCLLH